MQLGPHRVLDLGEDQRNPTGVEPRVEVGEHVGGRGVDVGHRLGRDEHPAQALPLVGHGPHGVPEHPRVGEDQGRVETEDDQPGQQLGVRVHLGVVQATEPLDPAELGLVGPPDPAEDVEDGQRDGEQDAGQHPEQRHPEQRRDGQPELRAPLLPEPAHRGDVGQRERGRDDDRAQGRLRHVLHGAGREEQDHGDDGSAHHPGHLGPRPGLLRHRGAGAAGADREPLEEPGEDVRRPDADHLLVAAHPLATTGRERRRCRHRVGQGHHRDGDGAEEQLGQVTQGHGRDGQRREALRQHADGLDPRVLQIEQVDREGGEHHDDEHRWHLGQQTLQQQDADQ